MPGPTSSPAALRVLTDGRFPSGGHAHSSGFEAAAQLGDLTDPDEIVAFLDGRLATTGVTDAWLIAGIVVRIRADAIDWVEADAEIEARIVSPALRHVSRVLGRQWLRAGERVWGGPDLLRLRSSVPDGPHYAASFAAVATTAGLTPADAVSVHLHHLVSAVTTAAVRLHGLDPFIAQRLHLEALERWQWLVGETADAGVIPWAEIPAPTGPMTDIAAELHAVADGRLFQS